jgi:hypothetical protein
MGRKKINEVLSKGNRLSNHKKFLLGTRTRINNTLAHHTFMFYPYSYYRKPIEILIHINRQKNAKLARIL